MTLKKLLLVIFIGIIPVSSYSYGFYPSSGSVDKNRMQNVPERFDELSKKTIEMRNEAVDLIMTYMLSIIEKAVNVNDKLTLINMGLQACETWLLELKKNPSDYIEMRVYEFRVKLIQLISSSIG
jgi:hypothetical protein